MIIVSDTTPIISLLRVNRLDLLEKLFGKVIIPQMVHTELTLNPLHQKEMETIESCQFLEVRPVHNQQAVKILMRATNLDIGESEAIVLTEEMSAQTILIDEKKGRRIAESMGLEIMGTVGILINAYHERFVSQHEAINCLDTMRLMGIRISDSIYFRAVKILTT